MVKRPQVRDELTQIIMIVGWLLHLLVYAGLINTSGVPLYQNVPLEPNLPYNYQSNQSKVSLIEHRPISNNVN